MGSVGANLVYLARGSAVGAFIPDAHIWDLVAGDALIRKAGGQLCYHSGKPIDYPHLLDGKPIAEPVLAAHPDLLPELQAAITKK